MSGRALQARRLRIWSANPLCVACGQLTSIAPGAHRLFELDHKVRLEDGGEDTDANCQVLCIERDAAGVKTGCHVEKTKRENRGGGSKVWEGAGGNRASSQIFARPSFGGWGLTSVEGADGT